MPETRFKLVRVRDVSLPRPVWYCERIDPDGTYDFAHEAATKFEAIKYGCRRWADLSAAIQQGRLH